jgi:hypothetical protein
MLWGAFERSARDCVSRATMPADVSTAELGSEVAPLFHPPTHRCVERTRGIAERRRQPALMRTRSSSRERHLGSPDRCRTIARSNRGTCDAKTRVQAPVLARIPSRLSRRRHRAVVLPDSSTPRIARRQRLHRLYRFRVRPNDRRVGGERAETSRRTSAAA